MLGHPMCSPTYWVFLTGAPCGELPYGVIPVGLPSSILLLCLFGGMGDPWKNSTYLGSIDSGSQHHGNSCLIDVFTLVGLWRLVLHVLARCLQP